MGGYGLEGLQAIHIAWQHTGDSEWPYQARVAGQALTIRVNDFPEEPLYTLLIGGREVVDPEDWPTAWVRPDIPRALLEKLTPHD